MPTDNTAFPTDQTLSVESPELWRRCGDLSTSDVREFLEEEWKNLRNDVGLQSALSAEGVDVPILLSLSGCPVKVRQEGQGVSPAAVFIVFQVILWTPQGKAIRKGIEETLQRHLASAVSPESLEKKAADLTDACIKWCRRAIETIQWRKGADAIGEPAEKPHPPHENSM